MGNNQGKEKLGFYVCASSLPAGKIETETTIKLRKEENLRKVGKILRNKLLLQGDEKKFWKVPNETYDILCARLNNIAFVAISERDGRSELPRIFWRNLIEWIEKNIKGELDTDTVLKVKEYLEASQKAFQIFAKYTRFKQEEDTKNKFKGGLPMNLARGADTQIVDQINNQEQEASNKHLRKSKWINIETYLWPFFCFTLYQIGDFIYFLLSNAEEGTKNEIGVKLALYMLTIAMALVVFKIFKDLSLYHDTMKKKNLKRNCYSLALKNS